MTRSLSAIAAICLVCLPALAEDVSTEDVYACAGISTDAERLACYDAAVGRLKAAEDAGEVTTVTRAEVEKVQRESFGFSIPSLPSFALKKSGGDADIEEVTLPIRSVRAGPYGKLTITLDNGQVWTQIDDNKVRAKNPEEAQIYQAMLGSYKMKIDGGRAFRVRREK